MKRVVPQMTSKKPDILVLKLSSRSPVELVPASSSLAKECVSDYKLIFIFIPLKEVLIAHLDGSSFEPLRLMVKKISK